MPQAHWSVTVERDGEQIVTISHNHLSGRDLSPEDEQTIRYAARHLLSFVGAELIAQPKHAWQFYANGTFCSKCGTQIGSGQPCR